METLPGAIIAAFAGIEYPGDDHLTIGHKSGRELDETFQLLRGKKWTECPVTELIRGDTPIPDLTPEAFHYYMPAFLLASIDRNHESCSDVASSLTFFLSPAGFTNTSGEAYTHYDDTENFTRRMSLFTREQRLVITRVLQEYVTFGWETPEEISETVTYLSKVESVTRAS